ncbi:MAG TPA: glycosyltransferase family 39 protein [Blastocatellia bacterium]|nr:glycosyltransferase family 39 protein [Blastocatellia bacterium]
MATEIYNGQGLAQAAPDPTLAKGKSILSRRTAIVALVLVAECFLLFANFDNAYLSLGEGNTALLGKNVLEYGYPRAWDGKNLVVPFYETTVNEDLVWVSHPWLQYYLAAGGIAVFGQTNLGARFIFALCGLLSIIALYYLTLRVSGSVRLAGLSALILAAHPLFWMYARQSRYYAPTILLMILVAIFYLKWTESLKKSHLAGFVIFSSLLFYSLYTIWGFEMLAIGVHYLLFKRSSRSMASFIFAAVAIGVLTLPFFLYAPPHFHRDAPPSPDGYLTRLIVHLWKVHTLYYPVLTLALIWGAVAAYHRLKGSGKPPSALKWRSDYWLGLSVIGYVFFVVLYPFFTTHYMLPVLPLGAIFVAFAVLRIREHSRWVAAPVLALLVSTNLFHVLPYIAVDKLHLDGPVAEAVMLNPTWTHTPGTPLSHYVTEQLALRSYAFDFLGFLTHDYEHQLRGVVTFIKENTREDQTVFVPWNDADAIAFYTGRKVGYHMETSYFKNENLKAVAPKGDDADLIVPLTFDLPARYYAGERFYSNYERIKLPFPKEYFETYPNLDFFNFRTNRQTPSWFYVFVPKKGGEAGYAENR